MAATNAEMLDRAVAQELALARIPPQFASIDEALDSHTVADGDAEAWTELLVRLHVRHCLLAYSPHGVDEWTRTERATLKTIGTKAAAAISGLLTRAKAKPADPKIPWLGVAGVILEYSLLTAAETNILREKRAQTAGKMPDEVLNLEVRILNDLDLVLHLESGEAFRELEKNLNTIRLGINDWRGATCDLLLTRVEMKREELPYEEWATLLTYPAEIIDMTIRAEENAFDLIDAHGARETFPYVTKEFWAWRLGRCIAAGAHLLPEIQERLDKRERFENHKPLPAAIDILLGFGSDRDDWHKLRANLVRATVNVWEASAWLGVNDVGDATVDMLKQTFEERLSPSIGLVGPTSDLYWLVRVGYVDAHIQRGFVSAEAYRKQKGAGVTPADPSLLAELVNALELAKTRVAQYRRREIEQHLTRAVFVSLPADVRTELVRAETCFSPDYPEEQDEAAQRFANAADQYAKHVLEPVAKRLRSRTRNRKKATPTGLGSAARLVRLVVEKGLAPVPADFAEKVADALYRVNECRPMAHGGDLPTSASTARSIVLGLGGQRSLMAMLAELGIYIKQRPSGLPPSSV